MNLMDSAHVATQIDELFLMSDLCVMEDAYIYHLIDMLAEVKHQQRCSREPFVHAIDAIVESVHDMAMQM
jgi:hypothetical protein